MQAYPSLSSICPKPPPRPTVALACLRVIQRVLMLAGIALIALPVLSSAAAPAQDLTQKSLEDLMSIDVTSVSKKEQKTSQAAAAVFVISREDISRSGALNIPDLLRMVPGVDVAQIDASSWAISVRGLNGQYSDKLLVLIDGRTVYTPIFAGVFWNSQNVPLDTCPVLRTRPNAQMIGVWRLTYRPHTKRTAAWFAELQSSAPGWIRIFEELTAKGEISSRRRMENYG
jgi:hypothetical protein